jgi:hypothetical protein
VFIFIKKTLVPNPGMAILINTPPNDMTTTEAIIEVRNTHTALYQASDKASRRAAKKAFKVAALNLWNAWKAEGHPEAAGEYLSIYGICFA